MLPAEGDLTVCPLYCWVQTLGQGLRGAHPMLCGWHDLPAVRSGMGLAETLREVALYLGTLAVRGSPRIEGIEAVLQRHGFQTGRLPFGTASQERRSRLAA